MLQDFKKLANYLLNENSYAKNSHSYKEVFHSIIKRSNSVQKDWVSKDALSQVLMKDSESVAPFLNATLVEKMIDFIQIDRYRNEINVVQFVAAMRSIKEDFKVWDLSKLMSTTKGLTKQTERKVETIERLRTELFRQGLTSKFKDFFSSKQEIKSVKKDGGFSDMTCTKATTLLKFLDEIKDYNNLHFS